MKCRNCNTILNDTDDYCSHCGAKVIRNRLTPKNLLKHIGETYFNYDNRLLRTFIGLIIYPNTVVEEYISGVRKKYINPFSFFGLALTLSGLSLFIIKKFYLKYFDIINWMSNIELFNNVNSQEYLNNYSTVDAMEYNSLMFSFMIPMFALISWIVFHNKKYNLTEHIVIYLYTISFFTIIAVIIGQVFLILSPENYITSVFFSYPIMVIYHCFLFKKLFNLNKLGILKKTLFFFVIFLISYIAFSMLIFLFQILFL